MVTVPAVSTKAGVAKAMIFFAIVSCLGTAANNWGYRMESPSPAAAEW
jgi:hypothetical protein